MLNYPSHCAFHGTKNWIYCTFDTRQYGIGFDFTFDARQRCRQIYNLFAYSFDLGKGEVKLVTTLTLPLTHVKDEVRSVVAVTTPFILVKNEVKYDRYTFTTLLNGAER